jgi:DnaJ-class molecular chaperone
MFQEINEAYSVLSDPKTKNDYELALMQTTSKKTWQKTNDSQKQQNQQNYEMWGYEDPYEAY